MMDSMMVSDIPMQMPVSRSSNCPVHSSAKSQSSRQVAATQTKKNVDKPVSWTVKMNSDKIKPTVPQQRERAASTCEGTWKNSLRQREKLLPAIPNPSARIDARMEERRKSVKSLRDRHVKQKRQGRQNLLKCKFCRFLGDVHVS